MEHSGHRDRNTNRIMLVLGIETSGRKGSIALWRDEQLLCERFIGTAGERHARTLVPEIDAAFREFGLRASDCETISVSIGPGSFTGLRVGVVCAKTIAWSSGCRLVAVDTFACIAENTLKRNSDVHIVADAQRGDVFVNRFRRDDRGVWKTADEIRIVNLEQWVTGLARDDRVSGPGLGRYGEAVAARACLLPDTCWYPRAAFVAMLGERNARGGEYCDPGSLEPFYLRRSSAEEKREQPNVEHHRDS